MENQTQDESIISLISNVFYYTLDHWIYFLSGLSATYLLYGLCKLYIRSKRKEFIKRFAPNCSMNEAQIYYRFFEKPDDLRELVEEIVKNNKSDFLSTDIQSYVNSIDQALSSIMKETFSYKKNPFTMGRIIVGITRLDSCTDSLEKYVAERIKKMATEILYEKLLVEASTYTQSFSFEYMIVLWEDDSSKAFLLRKDIMERIYDSDHYKTIVGNEISFLQEKLSDGVIPKEVAAFLKEKRCSATSLLFQKVVNEILWNYLKAKIGITDTLVIDSEKVVELSFAYGQYAHALMTE